MNRPHVDVLVVGAGPVGLTAAAELRRRSVAVRCVDAAHHHNVSTKHLGCRPGHPVPVSPYAAAEYDKEILRHRLHELGTEVERGVEVVGFTQDPGGVDAVLRHGDGSEHVRADWMIAADGARSSIRHQLGLSFEGGAFREEFATADVRVDWQLPADELFAFLNRGNFIAYFPMVGGRHRVAIAYNTRRAPTARSGSPRSRRPSMRSDQSVPAPWRSATDRGSSSTSARSRNSPLAAFSSPATPHTCTRWSAPKG